MKDYSISYYFKSFFTNPASLFVLTASLIFGTFLPTRLIEFGFFNKLSNLAIAHLPVARMYGKTSDFPSVSILYFSVMPFISPLIFFWSRGLAKGRSREIRELRHARPGVFYKDAAILLVSTVFTVPLFYLWNRGYDFHIMPINSSRLALGLTGWMVSGGIPFMLLAGALQYIRAIFGTDKEE